MRIITINETTGNPFKYFHGKNSISTCHRAYENLKEVSEVMNGLASILNLQEGINCLEIGAGGNVYPSESLTSLGAKVKTLDADGWETHNLIPCSLRDYEKLKDKDILIPHKAGEHNGIEAYMGDLAFLLDEKSELKDEKFDLAYFWGSLYGFGICSSVINANKAAYHSVKISEKDRIGILPQALKKNGQILIVSPKFNGHSSEKIDTLRVDSKTLLAYAYYFALGTDRQATAIGFIGGTNHIDDYDTLEGVKVKLSQRSQLQERTNEFAYVRDIISKKDQEKIRRLNVIDAAFVKF